MELVPVEAALDHLRARARRVEAEVDEDLEAYRARLPAKVLAQVRGESLARRWLDGVGLPRLSLFDL